MCWFCLGWCTKVPPAEIPRLHKGRDGNQGPALRLLGLSRLGSLAAGADGEETGKSPMGLVSS